MNNNPSVIDHFNLAGVLVLLMAKKDINYLFITTGYAILLYFISKFVTYIFEEIK